MTCRDGVGLLMDYTEARLAGPRRAQLEAHVGDCVRCRRFVASYRRTLEVMRQATAAALPERLGRRLSRLARIVRRSASGKRRR
jgi:anti-sigma factor RsiW